MKKTKAMEGHKCFFLCLLFVMVLICCNNCNGLRNINNFKKYIAIMSEKRVDFMLLQETFWDDNFVFNSKHLYDGNIFYSNGINHRQGVAILVNKKYKSNVEEVYKDCEGRFLHVKFEYENVIYNIISVYAHNILAEKAEFFRFIDNYIQKFDNVIIGGDFNTTLCKLDRASKSEHKEDIGVKSLIQAMQNSDIYDIWRSRNPESLVYSRKQICNNALLQSRIDYFLLHRNLSSYVQSVKYYDTSLSDHAFIEMKIIFDNVERGPGLWILNNTILENDEYVTKVKNIIQEEQNCVLYNTEPLIWWDNLKYKIKKFSQVFCKRIAKDKHSEYYSIQKKLQKMSEKIANGLSVDIAQYESLKLELSTLEEEKCRGAILRSKAHWATESDKCTKYFLNLETYRQENNCIKELIDNENKIVSDTENLLELQHKFYEKLYSCVQIDNDAMVDLLNHVPLCISDEDRDMCDSNITVEEISFALRKMSKNKSPGSDGLTTEFYCKFFDSLKGILLKLFNEVEENGQLSRSMRSGVLSLIYKQKGDKRDLKNYRPISLLQVDYKILARVMANRFKNVLCKIISICQTCCINGRDIADNIVNLRDIIDMLEDENMEGYIIKCDQEKAFDRISHSYMIEVLKKFGFGERFIRWIKIFYTDIQSSVKCNGFLTRYFKIKNGIRQGCPISAMLYVLSAEPLQYAIRDNLNIKGIDIPFCNEKAIIFQHADDTTLTVSDKESIQETLNVFDLYSQASGAKLNMSKSEIMCVGTGSLDDEEKKQLGLQYCEQSIQVLGVYIGKNKEECERKNWTDKIRKIKSVLNLWKQRHLTLPGRVTVISSLLVSRLWYTIAVSSIPAWALEELKHLCIEFLWSSGAHLIQYRTVIGNKKDGGLNVPDIYLKLLSFRLKFLGRFFDTECQILWKNTMRYFLRRVHGLNMDLEIFLMSLDKEGISNLPLFYQEMVEAWQFIRSNVVIDLKTIDIYNQPLFHNSEIQLNDKIGAWQVFIMSGIKKLKDITYEVVPGFLPFQAILDLVLENQSEIDSKWLFKKYTKLLSAIPDNWRKIVEKESCPVNDNRDLNIDIEFHGKVKELSLCKTKDFYNILLDKCFVKPNIYEFWEDNCDIGENTFNLLWKVVHSNLKPPDCIDLDFRILHNRIFTNIKLAKMKLVNSTLCCSCQNEEEDLFHIFLTCYNLNDFHQYIYDLLCELFVKAKVDLLANNSYKRLFILGFHETQEGVNGNFVNFILSIARLCIFKRRQMVKNNVPNVDMIKYFKYTVRHYVSYFYSYFKSTKRLEYFKKQFLKDNNIVLESNDILLFCM